MKELLRFAVAGLVGALAATTVAVGQPAVADQLDKKAAKVTSAMIKNGTIKKKDLSAQVAGPLAKADTALQAIVPGSVTTTEVADGSLTGADVADGSLTTADVAVRKGSGAYDVPNLGPGDCEFTAPIETGKNLTGDLILVSNPATVAGAIQIDGRQHAVTPTALDTVFCNVGTAAFDPPLANFHWVVIDN
jgi:hypothetical protein